MFLQRGYLTIIVDKALRFYNYFGNNADFWLGIQDEYDLREEKKNIEKELEKIPHAKVS